MKLSAVPMSIIRDVLIERLANLERAERKAPGRSKWRTGTIREVRAVLR
jgi:hypothetical protein